MAPKLELQSSIQTLLFLAYFWITVVLCEDKKNFLAEFDVKPGGEIQVFAETWKGITCRFTYSCQGGTKENWHFKMGKVANSKEYYCSVERPDGNSYLFFQQFMLQIDSEGANLVQASAEKSSGQPLGEEELKTDIKTNSVYQSENFESSLAKLSVTFKKAGKKGKKEL